MTETTHVLLVAEDEDSASRVIHEYVLGAIERLPETSVCEGISFAFDAHPETGESSVVALVLTGDADAIVSNERDRWESLTERGTIERWERAARFDRDEIGDDLGEDRAALSRTVSELSAEMAKLAYETFETRPAPVETFGTETADAPPIGWWAVLHHLTNQLNYSSTEELRAYETGVEHALRNVAEYEGAAAADERLDELVESLESKRDAIREGRRDS